jgi:hypothetical protein
MPQAVKIETQSEQQGLAGLHRERATGCASRKLALHRREYRFDQGTAPIDLLRKRPPHFGTHSAHPPGSLPALGGDHTVGPESLPDVGVIPLAVELGIGQHQPDPPTPGSRFDHRRQTPAVVPWATSRSLREQQLLIQIHHDQPLQPMPPEQAAQGPPPVAVPPTHRMVNQNAPPSRRTDSGRAGSRCSTKGNSTRRVQHRLPLTPEIH